MHRKLENFYFSSTHGAHASSLFSKWFACSHMQWFRAHTPFIILLTPCKSLFLCSVLNSHTFYFLVTSRTPTGSRGWELPLPGPWNMVLCLYVFIYLFFQMRFLFCGIQRNSWKKLFVAYLSLWDIEVLSSIRCQLQPTFFNVGSSVHGAPFSLSNCIYCSKFDTYLSFFPEWAANDVLYYTSQKNLKCQNVFMTTFTNQKHTKLVYTEQDAR